MQEIEGAGKLWSDRMDIVDEGIRDKAQTFIDFPPMQKGASFSMEGVKAQIEAAIAAHGLNK